MIQNIAIEFAKADLSNISTWPIWMRAAFCAIIALGLEILSHIVPLLFGCASKIVVSGKHLDKLESIDNIYITINKCLTMMFVYHLIQVTYHTKTIQWSPDELTIWNSVGSLIAFYIFYDFLYTSFHTLLHHKSIYSYIHKHHHRQKAPSRGNLDAINVHPFEFLVGEYIHLLAILVIPCHIYTVVFFILAGGILASLNHTRFNINIPYIYSVKAHDWHHVKFDCNYGQYTMLWDSVFGSYLAHGSPIRSKAE